MSCPEVFYYDFSDDKHILAELEPFLSEDRAAYCRGMKNSSAALRSAYCYMLLRLALKRKYGITDKPTFTLNEHGKPFLDNYSGIYFNMSHSDKKVVCAVAESPVGVDIQDIRHLNLNVGKKFLTDAELDKVRELNDDALDKELSRIWCIKESYGKMTGKGFGEGFRSFEADRLILENRVFLTWHNGFWISLCV